MGKAMDDPSIVEDLETKLFSDENTSVLRNVQRCEEAAHNASYENALYIMAVSDNSLTFHEVLEGLDTKKNSHLRFVPTVPFVTMLGEFYSLHVDLEAIKARSDNLLTSVPTDDGWRSRFDRALAQLLAQEGKPVSLDSSFYGWEDHSKNPHEWGHMVGVFDIQEDSWAEFAGTFASTHDHFTGITADVVYSSGYSRKARMEGTLGEIMRRLS